MNKLNRLTLLIVLLVIGGMAPVANSQSSKPNENTPDENRFADLVLQGSLKHISQHSWVSGSTPTLMKDDSNYCVLSRIAGKFRGTGEGVWIEQNKNEKQPRWQLNGTGAPGQVFASAICFPKLGVK